MRLLTQRIISCLPLRCPTQRCAAVGKGAPLGRAPPQELDVLLRDPHGAKTRERRGRRNALTVRDWRSCFFRPNTSLIQTRTADSACPSTTADAAGTRTSGPFRAGQPLSFRPLTAGTTQQKATSYAFLTSKSSAPSAQTRPDSLAAPVDLRVRDADTGAWRLRHRGRPRRTIWERRAWACTDGDRSCRSSAR